MALVPRARLGVFLQKPVGALAFGRKNVSCVSLSSGNVEVGVGKNPLEFLDSPQSKLVNVYVDTLLLWNERMNLISASSKKDIMDRHVSDSLALLPVIESHHRLGDKVKMVDVGSGAGLPGIVLGIARPSWEVTLLEATHKKCDFLEEVVNKVGLNNVKVVRGRAEERGRDTELRERFNVAVARAVAEMRVLAELCLPLVCVGGILVAAKGANSQEEARSAREALQSLGGSLVAVSEVSSESPFGTRTAIVCSKTSSTAEKYPRRPGMPAKRPLGS